jgi:hypothetical protein
MPGDLCHPFKARAFSHLFSGTIAREFFPLKIFFRGSIFTSRNQMHHIRGKQPMDTVTIREMEPDDCVFLFELVNDPSVRAISIQTDPIPREKHLAWCRSRFTINMPTT